MCGIAGIITTNTKSTPGTVVQSMLKLIRHRGPDNEGVYHFGNAPFHPINEQYQFSKSDNNAEVVLGHRRLSIIDLSSEAHQPMQSEDSRYVITYNGEIYNYIELKETLSKYYQFRTNSDTEVLIYAYKHWGKSMLNKLDGMYAFAILDKKAREVFCARDPLGIKPFYYTFSEGAFVFCSEPLPIVSALEKPRSIDQQRIAEFLLYGISDHDEGTSYKEVFQLRGGHYINVGLNGEVSSQKKFWSPPNTILDNDPNLIGNQKKLITEAISRQLRSDVTIGSSLSGGIDSGIIVHAAGELLGDLKHQYKTITFTSKNFKNDESLFAKKISHSSGISNWNEASIDDHNDIPSLLKDLIRQIGEPFSSMSILAQNQVMNKAKNLGVKVMLDGQGGDEVYLGYPRVAQGILGYYLKKGRIDKTAQELIGLNKNASIPIKQLLLGSVYFKSPSVARLRSLERLKQFVKVDFLQEGRNEVLQDKFGGGTIFENQIKELQKYILPRLLKYADRNSMAYSIESRVPHLSIPVVEHALQLPIQLRVKNGWTKYALRTGFNGTLPNEILWAKEKKGFEIPQKEWIKSIESTLIMWLEEAENLHHIFDIPAVIEAIQLGKAHHPHIWRVISTILWMKDIRSI